MKQLLMAILAATLCYNISYADDNDIEVAKTYEITNSKFKDKKFKSKIKQQRKLRKVKKHQIKKLEKKTLSPAVKAKTSSYLKKLELLSDDSLTAWSNILDANSDTDITYVKSTNTYKIQAEARLINNSYDTNKLKANLNVLKTLGYDSILVRFDCSEDLSVLKSLITDIKSNGFNIFITIVGVDRNKSNYSVFIEADTIDNYLKELAPEAVGIFLNWRRGTSVSHYSIPIEYFNYICNTVRKYNENILIYGEIFYGFINRTRETTPAIYSNIPSNVTGVVVYNYGTYNNNRNYAVKRMFKQKITNFDKLNVIGLVTGYTYGYRSSNNRNFDIKTEYKYKKAVEKSYLDLGCSTVTFLHDGQDIDEIEKNGYKTTDNILEEDLTAWEID